MAAGRALRARRVNDGYRGTAFFGLKRIALQVASIATCRTPWATIGPALFSTSASVRT